MCTDHLVPHIIGIVLGPAALFGGVLLLSHAGALSASGMLAVFGYIPDGTPAHPYRGPWGYSWGNQYWPTVPMPPLYRYYGCFTIFFALWTIGISAYGFLPGFLASNRRNRGHLALVNTGVLKKDLTTGYPRSVHEKVLGVVMLGRAIDKGIAFANGTNGEYNYDCPMDKAVFGTLGVDHDALLDVIKKANSESEIEAYLKPIVDKVDAAKIAEFNENFVKSEPEKGSPGHDYFLKLRGEVAPDRTDVTAWADLLDLDEKRPVPERVTA
jgi:hypothetical protein